MAEGGGSGRGFVRSSRSMRETTLGWVDYGRAAEETAFVEALPAVLALAVFLFAQ
jgi:hypothetical protein